MNFLDMRTVIFSHFVTNTLCALAVASLWYQNRKRFAGTSCGVLAFACQAAAALLIILRGSVPDWMSIVLANTLVIAGALAGYVGLERFVGKTSSQVHNYILLAAFAGVHTYFTFVQPDLAARTLNASLGLLIVCFQFTWLLLRRVQPDLRRMTLRVRLVFGAFCLIGLVRIVVTLANPQPDNDFFQSGAFDTLILLLYQMLLILLAYSLTLMVNGRLLVDIQAQEEKFAKAFRSSPYAMLLTRLADGHILEVNDGFVDVSGYSRAEAIGQTTLDLRLWAKEEERTVVVNELSKGQKVQETEFQFRKKSGAIVAGLYSAEIITLDDQVCVLSSINDITERKQAEEALRESEERYRNLFNNSVEGIFQTTPAGRYRTVNPAFARMFGYASPEDMIAAVTDIGQQLYVHPEDRQRLIALLRASDGMVSNFEAQLIRQDRSLFWVSINARLLQDSEGQASFIEGTCMDITARKQAEEELRLKALVMDQIQDHVSITDLMGNITYVNQSAANAIGRDKQEIVGQTIAIYGEDPERGATQREILEKTLRDGAWRGEVVNIAADGSEHVMDCRTQVINDDSGNLVALVGIATNITARKQTEEALRESKQQLNHITDNIPIIITYVNAQDFRFKFVNRTYANTFGMQPQELIGKQVKDILPGSTYERSLPDFERVRTGERVHYENKTVVPISGESRWLSIDYIPELDEQGIVQNILALGYDITARQQAEEALRESNAELQTRNEELDVFAHMVAHDLKNPLGVMMGYAGLLAETYDALSPEMIRQARNSISRNGRKAGHIIESLFMLASVRKQDVPAAPLDMAHIVDEVVVRLADSIQDRGADIHVPDCASWPVALGYAPWIEEIWVNYLNNALKYGGPRPRIDLGATRQPDGLIRFSVRDYGAGLTPEQQERLFAPFERLGQAQVEGHGLGLSVVRHIAEKLGGQVGVDSAPGTLRGSTFYFTLPAAPDL